MNWLDWVFICVLAVSTVIGLWRGLAREVMSVVIWAVAIWAALRYSSLAAEFLSDWITAPSMQALAGFAGILSITLIIGGLLVWLIGKLVDATGLSGTDRMFGLLFGLGRGVLIIAMALLVARFTPFPDDPWWRESAMLPYFDRLADQGLTILPENIREIMPSLPPQTPADDLPESGADEASGNVVLQTVPGSDRPVRLTSSMQSAAAGVASTAQTGAQINTDNSTGGQE